MTEPIDARERFNYARFAGVNYLIVIILGAFAQGFVRSRLIVLEDPAATVMNIQVSNLLFRLGFLSDLVMLPFYVLMAIGFYFLFVHVNRALSLLGMTLALVSAAILAANLLYHFGVLLVLEHEALGGAFTERQVQALVALLLEFHRHGLTIAGMFFGPWCLVLGWLVIRSGFMPKLIGYLLIGSFAGYLGMIAREFLWPDYVGALYGVSAVLAFAGEVSLVFWLLIFGRRVHRHYVARSATSRGGTGRTR